MTNTIHISRTRLDEALCECGCGEPAPLAQRTNTRAGQVRGRPLKYVSGHNSRGREINGYHEEDRGHSTACWIWNGALSCSEIR